MALALLVLVQQITLVRSMAISRSISPSKPLLNVGGDVLCEQKESRQPSVIHPNLDRNLAAWNPHTTLWSKISSRYVPKCDTFTATWDAEDDHIEIADGILAKIQHCFEGKKNNMKDSHRRNDLLCSIETFMAFCEEHLETDSIVGYELKISDLRGVLATQCPAYHADTVPVRWIETLHGPGTVYVDPNEYSYSGLLQNVVDNTPPNAFQGQLKWKEQAVQSLDIQPAQVEAGNPIILVGRRWDEVARPQYRSRDAVLHRSPTEVAKSQARVLLVLDVKVNLKVEAQCNCGFVH